MPFTLGVLFYADSSVSKLIALAFVDSHLKTKIPLKRKLRQFSKEMSFLNLGPRLWY